MSVFYCYPLVYSASDLNGSLLFLVHLHVGEKPEVLRAQVILFLYLVRGRAQTQFELIILHIKLTSPDFSVFVNGTIIPLVAQDQNISRSWCVPSPNFPY